MSMTGRYEFFEHTADVGLDAWADTLDEAFAVAADGMMAVITDGNKVDAKQQYTFEVESIDLEGLLVQFLTQLLILHETENVVLTDFQVSIDDNRASVDCGGEPFDEVRHGGGVHVKAVSYHMMEIEPPRDGKPAHIKVLFDI